MVEEQGFTPAAEAIEDQAESNLPLPAKTVVKKPRKAKKAAKKTPAAPKPKAKKPGKKRMPKVKTSKRRSRKLTDKGTIKKVVAWVEKDLKANGKRGAYMRASKNFKFPAQNIRNWHRNQGGKKAKAGLKGGADKATQKMVALAFKQLGRSIIELGKTLGKTSKKTK